MMGIILVNILFYSKCILFNIHVNKNRVVFFIYFFLIKAFPQQLNDYCE